MTNSKTSTSKGWVITSLALSIALICCLAWCVKLSNNNASVATVNGDKISKNELYDTMVSSSGKQTLDTMIGKALIAQEMKKANLSITDKEIDDEVAAVKKKIGTEEDFKAALTQYGIDEAYFRGEMTMNVQLKKLLADKIKVTDEEIKTYFDANKAQFKTPEQVHLHQIVVAKKDEATAILNDIKGGKDFAAVAKEKSTDTSSKDAGGDVGLIAKGFLDEEVEKVAFSIKQGELSQVIEADGKFYVIKVSEKKAETIPTLDEKKEDVKSILMDQKLQEQTPTWLNDVRAKSTITNTLAPTAAAK